MSGAWIAVACAEHVRRGREGGFAQVCHGKGGPLRRLKPGDGLAYYSPTLTMGGREPCRAFTAFGAVAEGEPYEADLGNGLRPWRRAVRWAAAREAPIAPLLDVLALTRGRRHWAAPFRFGLVAITPGDFALIAEAMRDGQRGCTSA